MVNSDEKVLPTLNRCRFTFSSNFVHFRPDNLHHAPALFVSKILLLRTGTNHNHPSPPYTRCRRSTVQRKTWQRSAIKRHILNGFFHPRLGRVGACQWQRKTEANWLDCARGFTFSRNRIPNASAKTGQEPREGEGDLWYMEGK